MTTALEDQFAIQNLLFRYARAADDRDAAALADCFVDGMAWTTGPGFETRGAKEMVEALRAMFEWTMHNVHNHEHQAQGDTATGYTYCVASHVKSEDGRRVKIDWYIRYQDELRRQDGRWRFVKRHLNVGLVDTVVLNKD